ncbi:MAG TPA: hypothetical protein PK466_08225 [Thermotogota bacterium]|nr:hypothetical protein [Thermotogota bacterium]HPJ87819.1 hypothetical protein [Thermotogota bacterium]HPR96303.1 hypothetical protein [Thermotogota bacterium]
MYWQQIDDVIYILILFALAVLMKRLIPAFRRYLIPNSIVAGFFGLLLGPNLLNLLPLNPDTLGGIIYHLMAIGFISLSLRTPEKTGKSWNSMNAGMIIVSTYLIQGLLGFAMSFLWSLADKNVSPIMGLILPMGFGQGPGQAFSVGNQWEQLGMQNGGAIGLAVAAAGFGWATVGGIIILNILLKKKRKKDAPAEVEMKKEIVVKDYEFSDMDGMTIQFVFIGIIYAAVYLILGGVNRLLASFGTFGESLGSVLWGFHFVFGAILAILFRTVYNKMHKKGVAKERYLNNFMLQRIAGFVFDFMVAASISAVTFKRIATSFWPIFFITFAGGVLTFFYVSFIVNRTMKEHRLANTIAFFGHLTGTISTGMALLREVDPLMKSGAPENMIFGSGVAIFFGFPLMALLSLPPIGLKTGNTMMYLYTFLGLIAYAVFLYVYWYFLAKRKNKKTY